MRTIPLSSLSPRDISSNADVLVISSSGEPFTLSTVQIWPGRQTYYIASNPHVNDDGNVSFSVFGTLVNYLATH